MSTDTPLLTTAPPPPPLTPPTGLLVRHATFIADELAGTGVIEILSEALKDKNERVRRRVMATLGELLFYIATQQQDPQGAGGSAAEVAQTWGITSGTFSLVARCAGDRGGGRGGAAALGGRGTGGAWCGM